MVVVDADVEADADEMGVVAEADDSNGTAATMATRIILITAAVPMVTVM